MPSRHHVPPAVLVLGLLAAAGLAACSYTEAKPDAAAQRTSTPAPGNIRTDPVVGTLPPLTFATTLPVAPPGAADDAAPLPPPEEETTVAPEPETTEPPQTAPPTAAPTAPPTTAPPATTAAPSSAKVALQVGSFSAKDGAMQLQAALENAGFQGFSTQGSGPFKVLRGGLTDAEANWLQGKLSAAGFESFVVRS